MTEVSRLCTDCRADLTAALRSLPGYYEECGRLLGGAVRQQGETSGSSMPGMPFNGAAADVRSSIVGVLSSWSGLVVGERETEAPRRAVRELAEFLGEQLGWLVGHPAAAEFAAEIAQLVRSARKVVQPVRVRRIPVGACVETGCGGALSALVRPGASGTEISCDADLAHTWPEQQWLHLRRSMGTTSAPRWVSAAHIARLWRVAPGSVYRLASEQKWRRTTSAGRKLYCEADVRRTFDSRNAPAASSSNA